MNKFTFALAAIISISALVTTRVNAALIRDDNYTVARNVNVPFNLVQLQDDGSFNETRSYTYPDSGAHAEARHTSYVPTLDDIEGDLSFLATSFDLYASAVSAPTRSAAANATLTYTFAVIVPCYYTLLGLHADADVGSALNFSELTLKKGTQTVFHLYIGGTGDLVVGNDVGMLPPGGYTLSVRTGATSSSTLLPSTTTSISGSFLVSALPVPEPSGAGVLIALCLSRLRRSRKPAFVTT